MSAPNHCVYSRFNKLHVLEVEVRSPRKAEVANARAGLLAVCSLGPIFVTALHPSRGRLNRAKAGNPVCVQQTHIETEMLDAINGK